MDNEKEQLYLEQYDSSQYEKLSVAVDLLIFTAEQDHIEVLLIKREEYPFKDCYALPGVFVDINESLDEAVLRGLEEETGLQNIYMEQLYTWGAVDRDPRMRVLSVSYIALVCKSRVTPRACKRVSAIKWQEVSLETIDSLKDSLAFDHAAIIRYALERLRNKVEYTPIAFYMMDEEFTLPHLQLIYEAILGKPLFKANFRKKIQNYVTETGRITEGDAHRPSKYYRFLSD